MKTGDGGIEVAADALGRQYEASLERGDRRRRGSFFTPPALAAGLLAAAVAHWPAGDQPFRVCDPSCGGGVFLLAAGRHLEATFGLSRAEIVSEHLWGVELADDAAAVSRAALMAWVAEREPTAVVTPRIAVADALLEGADAWSPAPPAFDLVIGNPPFQSQLSSATVRAADYDERVRELLGPAAAVYADTASLFLVAALDLVRPGGRVALILPDSFLATRDAAPARQAVTGHGQLRGLWLDGKKLFDASVRVCAPIVDRHDDDGPSADDGPMVLHRWLGPEVVEAPDLALDPSGPDPGTWAPLVADLRRLPVIELDHRRVLGAMAGATAGFRDQFYGLIPFVSERTTDDVDGDDGPGRTAQLVTSGLIDPGHCLWGRRSTRFGGVRWQAPIIDLVRMEEEAPRLSAWGQDRLAPKVLLATQTRVLEAVVDRRGTCWPSVPVVAVSGAPDQLSRIAAVLMAPPISVWAMGSFGGTALSSDAIKLAAGQVLTVPLPVDDLAWAAGSEALERAEACAVDGDGPGWLRHLLEMGAHMCEAYGVGPDVLEWWQGRLPPFRG